MIYSLAEYAMASLGSYLAWAKITISAFEAICDWTWFASMLLLGWSKLAALSACS